MVLNPTGTKKEAVKAVVSIVVGMITLGVFIIFLGGYNFWEDLDTYEIQFRSVKDLSAGRPVKFAGLTIGRVLDVSMDEQNPGIVNVDIGVDKGFVLYDGTVAMITQKGLVGDNFVLLELASEPGLKLEPGSIIPNRETVSMTEVAQKVGNVVEALQPKLESILDGLDKMIGSKNSQSLGYAVSKLPGLIDQANATLASIETNVDTLGATLNERVDKGGRTMEDTMRAVKRSVTTLQKDLSGLTRNADGTVSNIDEFVVGFDEDMDYNQEKIEIILANVEELSEELIRLARSLKERPYRLIYTPEQKVEE